MGALSKFKEAMDRLEESKRELDEAMVRLDKSMMALESAVPESWKVTEESLSPEGSLDKAEEILSRYRLPC